MKNVVATLLVAFMMLSPSVLAVNSQSVFYARSDGASSKQSNKVKSSSQAVQIVKSRVGGKVLKVKNNGRSSYKVKVIKDNGHIINVTVDAKSGKVK